MFGKGDLKERAGDDQCYVYIRIMLRIIPYRDHKNYCIEDNCGHDKDFKWLGIHHPPHFIEACVFVLRHVALSWFGCHRELNAVSLKHQIRILSC